MEVKRDEMTQEIQKKKQEPAYTPVEGNGFSINPDEVREILKQIKWSDETARSWIAINLSEDVKGDLINGLAQLPKEKAEKFIREIQERAEQHQPELL